MTMSTMPGGSDPSRMLIVPAAGFPEIISPFWREEELLRLAEIDWRRLGRRNWTVATPRRARDMNKRILVVEDQDDNHANYARSARNRRL